MPGYSRYGKWLNRYTNFWDYLFVLAASFAILGFIACLIFRSMYSGAAQAQSEAPDYHAACDKAGVAGYGGVTLDDPCEWEPANGTVRTVTTYHPRRYGPDRYTYEYYATLNLQDRNDSTVQEELPQSAPINGQCFVQMWQDKIRMIEVSGQRYLTEDNPDWLAKPAAGLRQQTIDFILFTATCAVIAAVLGIGPGRQLRGAIRAIEAHPEMEYKLKDWNNF